MTRSRKCLLRSFCRDEHGQVVPLAGFLLVGLLGMCAIVLDVGRALYSYRELQATTDAAALAGGEVLHTATATGQVTAAVTQYSSAAGGYNVRNSLPNVTVTSSLKCLTTLQAAGQPCIGNVPYNAIQVWQQTSIPTFFGRIFGYPTIPMATTALSSARGGSPRPSNVAVIIDSTLSMNTYDADCGATQMQCALNGFQILLQRLLPCPSSQSACANSDGTIPNTFDRVSLFTFPALYINATPIYQNYSSTPASTDVSCTTPLPAANSSNGYWPSSTYGTFVMPLDYATQKNFVPPFSGGATSAAYTLPPAGAASYNPNTDGATYQLTGFLADYRLSSGTTLLNPSSLLVKAAGASTACGNPATSPNGSMMPPNYAGITGTYYAGALYAAQSALYSEQALYPGSQNVLIILSDGNATAGDQYNSSGQYTGPGNTEWGIPVFGSSATNSGTYPSYAGMCGQAVTAAQAASAAGTLVYSVAYGSPQSGCLGDQNYGAYRGIVPCQTMAQMASAPQYFFSDYRQSGSNSICASGQPVTSLSGIFTAIANDLTEARLLPIGTQ